jgi:hypothetical protein
LAGDIEAAEFGWCKHPKIICSYHILYNMTEPFDYPISHLKRVVKECRRDIPNLESISLCEASSTPFDWKPHPHGFARIDIKVNGLEFQLQFRNRRVNDNTEKYTNLC